MVRGAGEKVSARERDHDCYLCMTQGVGVNVDSDLESRGHDQQNVGNRRVCKRSCLCKFLSCSGFQRFMLPIAALGMDISVYQRFQDRKGGHFYCFLLLRVLVLAPVLNA
jgi:hypothetical protein